LRSKGSVRRRGQTRPSKGALSVGTLVAVRLGEQWRFTHFQNTRYRPFADTLLGKLLTFSSRLAPSRRDRSAPAATR
jgi:hypothetical protein